MEMNEIISLYKAGNYEICLNIFDERLLDESDGNTQLSLKLDNINEICKECLYKNNTMLCEAIVEKSKSYEKWAETMSSYIKLHSKYRSLKVIPLDLELNVVYNMLWWFCVKPQILENKSLYFKIILDNISKCIVKVSKTCQELVLGQELCSEDVSRGITLLKKVSDQLLSLPPVACMQLLDVISLTVHVMMRQGDAESVAECMSLMRRMVDQVDLLRLHIQHDTVTGNEELYFKFGLTCVNSTASLKNCGECIDAFVITGALVCAVNSEFKHAMDCLKQIPEAKNNVFQFLINYLKAFCCLHSHHSSEAKLSLAYCKSVAVSPQCQAHYQLLLGRLQGQQGDHKAALKQCEETLASARHQPDISSLAAHLAAIQAHKLHLSTAQLIYLKQLVQYLRTSSSQERNELEGFEEWCLSRLNQQYSITLPEAVYTLARQLYLTGYHIKALDSYGELLELLNSVFYEASPLLPLRIQILQEAVLAHLKANRLTEGEQLCRQLVREYVPTGTTHSSTLGYGRWEAALYRMEEDVVSMILLADITAHTDKSKALEELNRCYNTVSESLEQEGLRQDTNEAQAELCDWVLSRILLRKAKLSSSGDAAHYFRRALIHKPGDKEVMFHYKQWSLWNPDHQSFDPGDCVRVFPEDQLHNLALRYILGCSVSEEEWGNLFDQESSQNVLESLFDDDD